MSNGPTTEQQIERRNELCAFSAHYDYDTSYLIHLLDTAPSAFAAFSLAQSMAQRRTELPAREHAIACISVMLHENCGACGQLNLRMATEVGVDRTLLQTLLDNPADLPPELRDVYEHAHDVVRGTAPDPQRTKRLRSSLGDAAFGDLAVTITGARIYPALKRALGTATACPRPRLDF